MAIVKVRRFSKSEVLVEELTPLDLKAVHNEAERNTITSAMSRSNQNIIDAGNALGVTRPPLYKLLELLGLKVLAELSSVLGVNGANLIQHIVSV